jgi:hypothetical protein
MQTARKVGRPETFIVRSRYDHVPKLFTYDRLDGRFLTVSKRLKEPFLLQKRSSTLGNLRDRWPKALAKSKDQQYLNGVLGGPLNGFFTI